MTTQPIDREPRDWPRIARNACAGLGLVLIVAAAMGVDWRLGAVTLGVCLMAGGLLGMRNA
jgi:hypothetical protein